MAEKKCKKCGHIKDEKEFYQRGANKRRADCSTCFKQYKRILNSKPELRYKEYRRSAKRRNIDFRLTLAEFRTYSDSPCRYCGSKVHPISLDRIDNDIGYIRDNVDSCCHRCNSLKHVFDEKEFLDHITAIYVYQANKIGLEDE
jgi:hypothetical protein